MSPIDVKQLVAIGIAVSPRAAAVAHDEAVQKSWLVARDDIGRAVRSTGAALGETRAAWRRSDPYRNRAWHRVPA